MTNEIEVVLDDGDPDDMLWCRRCEGRHYPPVGSECSR